MEKRERRKTKKNERMRLTCWGLHLYEIVRLHQAGGGHEESRIGHAPGCGNDLSPTALHWRVGNGRVKELELAVADRFIAERALAGGPLKALHNRWFDRVEQLLVHLRCQRVILQNVRPCIRGPKGPNGSRCEYIPFILGLKKIAKLLARPLAADHATFNVFRQALLQWLGNHCELVLLVGRLGKAFEGRRIHHRFAEGHRGIGDADINV